MTMPSAVIKVSKKETLMKRVFREVGSAFPVDLKFHAFPSLPALYPQSWLSLYYAYKELFTNELFFSFRLSFGAYTTRHESMNKLLALAQKKLEVNEFN